MTEEKRARNRPTVEQEGEFVRLYNGGMTVREVSAETGFGYGTAHRVLKQHGVLRPRGGKSRKKN